VDALALERERDRLIHAEPAHLHVHVAPRRAAEHLHGLIGLPALGGLSLDLDELVARTDPRAGARRAGDGRHDGHVPVALGDLEADTAVVPLRADAEVLGRGALEERAVRVLELVDQPVDRGVVEAILGDRDHVVARDPVHDLLEQARLEIDVLLLVHAPLEEPAAGDDGGGQHGGRREDRASISHGASERGRPRGRGPCY
jgi:hypothetical protein